MSFTKEQQELFEKVLPYMSSDLQLFSEDDRMFGGDQLYHVVGYKDDCLLTVNQRHIGDFNYTEDEVWHTAIDAMKYVLRPMSDLVKEIEINREKFVPIVELSKLITQTGFSYGDKEIDKIEFIPHQTVARLVYEWDNNRPREPKTRSVFEIDTDADDVAFSILSECPSGERDDEWYLTGNIHKMYQQLYKWKFDIHGLIPKEKAIDVNNIIKIDVNDLE